MLYTYENSHNPEMSIFLPCSPLCAGNQLHRKDWRGCFVRSVHLLGSVSLEAASAQLRECYQCFGQDTVVAIVGEPQWLALIPRALVQMTSALVPLSGDTRRFPSESSAAIPWLSNTQSKPGELQLWCVGKSWVLCWVKLFPTSGFSV